MGNARAISKEVNQILQNCNVELNFSENEIQEALNSRKAHEETFCKQCSGLHECQFTEIGEKGYEPIWSEWAVHHPAVKACRYRIKWARQKRADNIFQGSGLPQSSRIFGFDKLRLTNANKDAITAALDTASHFRNDLFLSGPPGSGKTAIVCAVAHEFLLQGIEIKYVTSRELVSLLKFVENDFATNFKELSQTPCLVIEDLGEERASQYHREQLEALLNKRHRSALITIITSRRTKADLVRYYEGAGGASRLNSELTEEVRTVNGWVNF